VAEHQIPKASADSSDPATVTERTLKLENILPHGQVLTPEPAGPTNQSVGAPARVLLRVRPLPTDNADSGSSVSWQSLACVETAAWRRSQFSSRRQFTGRDLKSPGSVSDCSVNVVSLGGHESGFRAGCSGNGVLQRAFSGSGPGASRYCLSLVRLINPGPTGGLEKKICPNWTDTCELRMPPSTSAFRRTLCGTGDGAGSWRNDDILSTRIACTPKRNSMHCYVGRRVRQN
jgi:hypothetical protein